jgi:hypothetical protein
LSPREVQQRVRAGESAEFVAQETGWDLARVTRYAEPPLRERSYVAECALNVQLHHSRGSSTLESVVALALGAEPGALAWDSAYLDGQWVVYCENSGGFEKAQWSYEPSGKTVNPLNASARSLMGLDPVRQPATEPSRESTIIVDTTAARITPQIEGVNPEASSQPTKLAAVPELVSEVLEFDEPVTEPEIIVTPEAAATKKTRKGRAKVPSWDEILFGSQTTQD